MSQCVTYIINLIAITASGKLRNKRIIKMQVLFYFLHASNRNKLKELKVNKKYYRLHVH
jgi:hypothetical protein